MAGLVQQQPHVALPASATHRLSSWIFVAALAGIAAARPDSMLERRDDSAAEQAAEDAQDAWNTRYEHYILIVWGAITAAAIAWNVLVHRQRIARLLAAVNSDSQSLFSVPSRHWARLQKHVLYAPLFSVRHSKEIMLTPSFRIGIVATRLQTVCIAVYFGVCVVFCFANVDYSRGFDDSALFVLHRAGVVTVVNMIPLFIMAGRNNPVIQWARIPFDTFNLLHRWLGRMVVLGSFLHVFTFIAMQLHSGEAADLREEIRTDSFIIYGLVAFCSFFVITLEAWSPMRLKFYETFKYLHILLVIAALVGLWHHLRLGEFVEVNYVYGLIALWSAERATRLARIVYRNLGARGGKALVEILPGAAVRITVHIARPWHFKPGQHAYLYMPSIGLLTSHPFSVAWTSDMDKLDGEGVVAIEATAVRRHPTICFIARARTGFTKTLVDRAACAEGGVLETTCYVEGPYGGLHSKTSYGSVVLVAGGVGITHQIAFARELVEAMVQHRAATRKVVLIWGIQELEHMSWIQPWRDAILALASADPQCFRMVVFVNALKSAKESYSSHPAVQIFPGMFDVGTLLDHEIREQVGAMHVSVCGPGVLSDAVRKAVRDRQDRTAIDFEEESFSW